MSPPTAERPLDAATDRPGPLAAAGDEERPPCPAPAKIHDELAKYESLAATGRWDGPRYRLTYRIAGDGPPLFVLPGIASTYRIYAIFLNQLGSRFRTIIYDYPGEHDDDGARLSRISHDDLVDDLFGLIDHLNVGRAFLVGLSFGSTVALKALRREPRRFPRGALQGAFAFRHFSAAERLALATWPAGSRENQPASVPPPGDAVQRPARVSCALGRSLAVLRRAERRDADPVVCATGSAC